MLPGVFISYSHHSDDHVRDVHDLARKLKADGISVVIDRDMLPGGPDTGWTTWSLSELERADRVLVAFTPTYRRRYDLDEEAGKGLGSTCEAAVIRRLVAEAAGRHRKIRVIVFSEADCGTIPTVLSDLQHFRLYESDGYPSLVSWLRGVPVHGPVSSQRLRRQWPVPLSDCRCSLVGRGSEFAAFVRAASGDPAKRILIVQAESNGGKTALVNDYYAYARRAGLAASRIDLKGCLPLADVLEGLRGDLRDVLPRAATGHASSYQVVSDLQAATAPILLAFDTYEQASPEVCRWLEGVVLPRLESSSLLLVVLAGQKVPEQDKHCWGTLTERFALGPVEDVTSWQEYALRTFAVDIDAHKMQLLVQAAKGNPGLLNTLLGNLVPHRAPQLSQVPGRRG